MLTLGPRRLLWRFAFIGILFFDLITGYMIAEGISREGGIFSPSQLGRFIILGYLLTLLFEQRIAVLTFIFGIAPFLVIELSYGLVHEQTGGLLYGLISIIKVAALFIPFLITLDDLDRSEIAHSFKLGLIVMSVVIIASLLADIGKPTYGSGGFGTKSYFPSGNDIGAYLGSGTLMIAVARYYRLLQTSLPTIGLLVLGLVCIGSRASLLFCAITLLFLAWHSSIRWLILLALTAALWQFYVMFIEIFNVVGEIMIRRYVEADGDLVRFIVSGRNEFIQKAFEQFTADGSVIRFLIGQGIFIGPQATDSVRVVDFLEADGFDLFFMFGLLGLAAYGLLWASLWSRCHQNRWLLLPIGLLLAHSALAGHVLFSGLFLQTVLALVVLTQIPQGCTIPAVKTFDRNSQDHKLQV
jgi:hypothetical protein